MDALLSSVLEAHGGLDNWSQVTTLTVKLALGGPFWGNRGWPGVYAGQTVRFDARREHITFTPFTAPGLTSVLDVDPERVVIQAVDGRVVDERAEPRGSFPMPYDFATTPWDAIQVAYFASAAVWNYLTEPFGFTYPGVQAREIEPWEEDGQTWRRLAVTFPDTTANHNAKQVFYYDEHFMHRRMDYSPDVTGNPLVAHYTYDQKTFDGFVFPTRRLVCRHDAEGIADLSFAPITLNVYSVGIERA
jgi:phage tail protein X